MEKKLIILITDGYPEGKHKSEYYELSLLTKNAILKARKKGIEVFSFLIIPEDLHLRDTIWKRKILDKNEQLQSTLKITNKICYTQDLQAAIK